MDAVEDYNFGLGEDVSYYDSADDNIDHQLVYDRNERVDHDTREIELPWYLIKKNNWFLYRFNLILILATWLSLFEAPLSTVFTHCVRGPHNPSKLEKPGFLLRKSTYFLVVTDLLWCVKIIIQFFESDPTHMYFKKTSLRYLSGSFVIDVAATLIPLSTFYHWPILNLFAMLRYYHLRTLMKPISDCMRATCLRNHTEYRF